MTKRVIKTEISLSRLHDELKEKAEAEGRAGLGQVSRGQI